MTVILHFHRGSAFTPRLAGLRAMPAPKARRAVDHDAVPLGLLQAVRSKVDASAAEQVKRVLSTYSSPPRRIDRNHHVRLLAISSRDGAVTYIDCRVPDYIYVQRKVGGTGAMAPDRPLNEHEEIEWMLMKLGGWSYPRAHVVATIAEDLVVDHMGFVPESYQAVMKDLVTFAEREPDPSPPPDPFLTWEDTQCTDDCDCDHCKGEVHASQH